MFWRWLWDRNSMYIYMYMMMIAENNYYILCACLGIFACARDQLYRVFVLHWTGAKKKCPCPSYIFGHPAYVCTVVDSNRLAGWLLRYVLAAVIAIARSCGEYNVQ